MEEDINRFEEAILSEFSAMGIYFEIDGDDLVLDLSKFPDMFGKATPQQVKQTQTLYEACLNANREYQTLYNASFDVARIELQSSGKRGLYGKFHIREGKLALGLIVFGALGICLCAAK